MGLLLAVCMLGPAVGSAFASSGEITSAFANSTWTKGSVTGSVTWDGCGASVGGPCQWVPLVKVQSTLENRSAGSALEGDGPTLRTFWNGGGHNADGTIPINEPNGYLLQGVYGQRACLVAIYSYWYVDPTCVSQYETFRKFDEEFHLPPPEKSLAESCKPEQHIGTTLLANRIFVVETPSPTKQQETTPPPPSSSTTPPTAPTITAFASSSDVKLSSGIGTITAGCGAANTETCTFALTLIATVKGAHASSTKHVTIGTVTGSVPGGKSGKLTIKYSSRCCSISSTTPRTLKRRGPSRTRLA